MQDNPQESAAKETSSLNQNTATNISSLQNNSLQTDAPNSSIKKEIPFKESLPISAELNPNFEKILTQLKQELIVEGYSLKTIKMYTIYTREMIYFINKPFEKFVKQDIISYLASKKEKGCNNATLSLVHAAMQYLFKKNHMVDVLEEIKIPKKAKSLPKVLTRDEIKKLFESTHFGRNRLMLQFMYGSGCRVSEVTKIKVEDLNLKEKTATVREGKGNKDRIIVLSKEWIHGIKKYLAKKRIQSEFVFSKKNGKPITTDTIQRIVRESAVNAGINKHVTPHCLRHSYATHLLEAGTNIRYIQTLLGHSSLNTTQIYTSVANDQLKKVVSPLDKL
jgi:site-specific recombinase XerD